MNSATHLLRREEVILPATDDTSAALADALSDKTIEFAERELGYVPPSEKARRAQIEETRKKLERPLGKALVEAGIKPFSHESVRHYKIRMARSFRFSKEPLANKTGSALVLTGFVLSATVWILSLEFIGLGVFGISLMLSFSLTKLHQSITDTKYKWIQRLYSVMMLLSIAGSGLIIACIADEFTGPPKKLWRRVPLKGYEGDIPRFALETAQEIKMRCPDAQFFVEELVENEARKDPFLVAQRGEEEVWVEVWVEPGFEQKRVA